MLLQAGHHRIVSAAEDETICVWLTKSAVAASTTATTTGASTAATTVTATTTNTTTTTTTTVATDNTVVPATTKANVSIVLSTYEFEENRVYLVEKNTSAVYAIFIDIIYKLFSK